MTQVKNKQSITFKSDIVTNTCFY